MAKPKPATWWRPWPCGLGFPSWCSCVCCWLGNSATSNLLAYRQGI